MFRIRDSGSGKKTSQTPDPWGKKAPDLDLQHWLLTDLLIETYQVQNYLTTENSSWFCRGGDFLALLALVSNTPKKARLCCNACNF
jgi:hypothetical protein